MHVTRTVKNDVNKWMLGLPDTQTECSTGNGLTSCRTITRTVNEFGEVITESTSSSDALEDTKLFVTYERDKFGNVTKTLADDAFGNHREGTTVYDDDGMFPVNHINALGHTTKTEYDEVLGVLKRVTNANGLVTDFEYDGFGRLTLEKRPDGSSTTITRTRERGAVQWSAQLALNLLDLASVTQTIGGMGAEPLGQSLWRSQRDCETQRRAPIENKASRSALVSARSERPTHRARLQFEPIRFTGLTYCQHDEVIGHEFAMWFFKAYSYWIRSDARPRARIRLREKP